MAADKTDWPKVKKAPNPSGKHGSSPWGKCRTCGRNIKLNYVYCKDCSEKKG